MYSTTKPHRLQKQDIFWNKILKSIKQFCLETSMHGFSHIAAPGRHWSERFLWTGILCVSLWGMAEISLGQLQRYRDNPTVVTLEKDFRSWNFSLPAVTACSVNRVDPKKLVQAIKSRWNLSPEDDRYGYYQRFVSTVANSNLFHLQEYEEFANDATLNVDLKELVLEVMVDMAEREVKITSSLNINMQWYPVMTEAGICYVTNSLAFSDIALLELTSNDTRLLPHTCRYTAMTCWIMMEAFHNVDLYVHSPYDVADMTAEASRSYLTLNRLTELRVGETRAGAGVRALHPRRRRCLYTDEPTDSTRKVYSTNTCRLACRSRLARQLCGCVPFYYFYDAGTPCGVSGMRCLAGRAARLAGVHCPCSQQCVDAIYRELATDDQIWDRGIFQNKGSVRFSVQAPRSRYTREIVFHFQDLVVSFGGAAGLFLGASFISFVEILYFLIHSCLRLFAVKDIRPSTIKKSRVPFESTRIQDITAILQKRKKYSDGF